MIRAYGIAHVTLTVSDINKAHEFYQKLFDTEIPKDNDYSFSLLKVGAPCWFTQWGDIKIEDVFDEKRIGLDHVAFKLNSMLELENVIQRLNNLKIKNAGLERFAGKYPYVCFRDPDNIQVEFFINEEI